jgi:hypothetical protein
LIHLGYGVEFEQPAIVAEALAETAVHESWIGDFLQEAEVKAKSKGDTTKRLFTLLDDIRSNSKLMAASHYSDSERMRDGLLKRARDEILDIAAQYKVNESDLELRTAEMINAAAYACGSAVRPDKAINFDFFLMHHINASIFFSAFLAQDWLSLADKVRLLEWKVRVDLLNFATFTPKDLHPDEIHNYKPEKPDESSWPALHARITTLREDGHGSKLIRALQNGERVCQKFIGQSELANQFRVKDGDWLQMANMTIDSVGRSEQHWVYGAKFDEAWAQYVKKQFPVLYILFYSYSYSFYFSLSLS